MAKANTSKKPTAAQKRQKKLQLDRELVAYGKGCSSGHHFAMKWLQDRQRALPTVYPAALQHVMLRFMDAHHKARGAKRAFIRGEVVGFFSTLESPAEAVSLELWRLQQEGES